MKNQRNLRRKKLAKNDRKRVERNKKRMNIRLENFNEKLLKKRNKKRSRNA